MPMPTPYPRRRRGGGCLGWLLLSLLAVGLVLFGLLFVVNHSGLRTRVQSLGIVSQILNTDVADRALDFDLLDRVRDSNLADLMRDADLVDLVRGTGLLDRLSEVDLDQINIDPAIVQQVRDHGSLPTLPDATATCPPPLILSAEWGNHDGGNSLAVRPSDCVRTSGLAMPDAVWNALVAADSSANAPGMRDQLLCHMVGAQEKPTWNLEPWRPQVGLAQTMLAFCNP